MQSSVLNSAILEKYSSDKSTGLNAKRLNRYVIFPIQDREVWEFYKKQEANIWTAEEVDMSTDVIQWNTVLNEDERHYIKHVLAFFAASDGIVAQNVDMNFVKEVEDREWIEALFNYQFQIMMENIHNESYSLMIEVLVGDANERQNLFNAIATVPSIKRKAEWAMKWMGESNSFCSLPDIVQQSLLDSYESSTPELQDYIKKKEPTFAERLVAFAAVEGIFFSGSFCAIYWLKAGVSHSAKNLMPGLCMFNALISRDEGMHQEFACMMYKKECQRDPTQRIPEKMIHSIICEAVDIEKEFVTEALPVRLMGMNSELMKQYIESVADRLCLQLGYEKIYNAEQPFSWMELISMNNKTNFFEERVPDYAKRGISQSRSNNNSTPHPSPRPSPHPTSSPLKEVQNTTKSTLRFDVEF